MGKVPLEQQFLSYGSQQLAQNQASFYSSGAKAEVECVLAHFSYLFR